MHPPEFSPIITHLDQCVRLQPAPQRLAMPPWSVLPTIATRGHLQPPESGPALPLPTILQDSHVLSGRSPSPPCSPQGPARPTPVTSCPQLPLSPWLTLLRPHRPPPCSSNAPGTALSRAFAQAASCARVTLPPQAPEAVSFSSPRSQLKWHLPASRPVQLKLHPPTHRCFLHRPALILPILYHCLKRMFCLLTCAFSLPSFQQLQEGEKRCHFCGHTGLIHVF